MELQVSLIDRVVVEVVVAVVEEEEDTTETLVTTRVRVSLIIFTIN